LPAVGWSFSGGAKAVLTAVNGGRRQPGWLHPFLAINLCCSARVQHPGTLHAPLQATGLELVGRGPGSSERAKRNRAAHEPSPLSGSQYTLCTCTPFDVSCKQDKSSREDARAQCERCAKAGETADERNSSKLCTATSCNAANRTQCRRFAGLAPRCESLCFSVVACRACTNRCQNWIVWIETVQSQPKEHAEWPMEVHPPPRSGRART